MLTHFIRFGVVLVALWGSLLWILLQQELATLLEGANAALWSWSVLAVCSVLLSLSIWWIHHYYHTIFYAIGKPWMNPQIPSMKRLEMHVPLRLYDDVDKARRAACLPHMVACNTTPPMGSGKMDLLGGLTRNVWLLDSLPWKFQLCSTVEDGLALVQQDTAAAATGSNENSLGSNWASIKVPGHWMLQGFDDIPIYTNKKYPFPCTPPVVPRQNPTGVYKLAIDFPSIWKHGDDEYTLLIHGMESACFVYWNGTLLGFCKDSRLPSEFTISKDLLLESSDTPPILHLVVVRWSDGSYMEDQDHWWMAGLHRSVELIRRPSRADILDYRVRATAARELTVAVQLRCHERKSQVILESRLYEDSQLTADGDKWHPAQRPLWSQTKEIAADDDKSATTTLIFESSTLPDVKLWTAETPILYTLVLIQSDATTGDTLQVETCRVGFRSIEIRQDGVLRVNGEPITICGINRHEHDPDYGKVVSLDRMKQDIVTLKYVIQSRGSRQDRDGTHQIFFIF